MTTKKKSKSIGEHLTFHLPHSVSVAFFGILLIASLGANLGFLVQIQNETDSSRDYLYSPTRPIGNDRVLYQGRVYSLSEDYEPVRPSDNETLNPFEISFLQDDTCTSCVDLNPLRDSFSNQFPTATIRDINAFSPEGQEMIQSGVSVLPAVIFSKSFEESPLFSNLTNEGILLPIENKYYEFRTGGNKIILNPEQLPETNTESGKLVVVGYVDFLSPASARFFTETSPDLLAQFGDSLSLDIRPFASDPAGAAAAEAVLCGSEPLVVVEKGPAFLENINAAFSAAQNADEAEMEAIFSSQIAAFADDLRMNEAQKSCLENNEQQQALIDSVNEAAQLGINGAPAFFIGKYFLGGEQDSGVMSSVVSQVINQ